MSTATATRVHLSRGDYAMTMPWTSPPERVRVVRAERIPRADGAIERWLHVEFPDGSRLLMHPSRLDVIGPDA